MKKRLLGTMLAAVLVVSQAVTAFAAGSSTTDVTTSGESAQWYDIAGTSRENFAYLEATEGGAEVLELIMDVNEGEKKLEDLAEAVPAIAAELEGKTLVTKFFELTPINGGKPLPDGSHEVTLAVPELTRAMVNVKLLHYSTVRNVWEVITPSDVNYDTKQITAVFKDLSPVAVISDMDESKLTEGHGTGTGTATGTSPKTGVESDWWVYLASAAALLGMGACIFVSVRRKKA